jgi:prevent-host-death family protein
MPRIGLRELKIHLSEVARDVQENRTRYTVTSRGEPVAVLVPYSQSEEAGTEERQAAWNELADLLRKAGDHWVSPLSPEEIIREMRE